MIECQPENHHLRQSVKASMFMDIIVLICLCVKAITLALLETSPVETGFLAVSSPINNKRITSQRLAV